MEAELARMAAHGIQPEKPPYAPYPGGPQICFLRDPDGYRIELLDRNPRTSSRREGRPRPSWPGAPHRAGVGDDHPAAPEASAVQVVDRAVDVVQAVLRRVQRHAPLAGHLHQVGQLGVVADEAAHTAISPKITSIAGTSTTPP